MNVAQNRASATIRYRWEIGYPHSLDLCEAVSTLENACRIAAKYSLARGHCIVVYDRMAHRGAPCEWAVQRDGSARVVRVKP